VLPDNPLPEANALEYIQQVGKALKIVHQKGLLHRDIKPHNLIFREDNQQVVLINFGIAREFCSGAIQTHTNLATDGYAPIEQYLVKAKRTPATDVYALAATLYTLLTAKIPIAATVRNHTPLPSPKRIRPELSPQISNAVMYGMALEQEERPSSVDEWLALLSPEQGNNISVAKVNSKPIRQKQLTSFSSNSRILNPVNNQDFDELGAETYRQGEAEIALGENKNALKNELNTKEKKSVKIIVSDESAKQLNSNNRLWNILIIIGLILLGLDYAWLKYMHYLEEIQTQPNIINNR
jgi:serine/threonine protein kinase